MYGRIFKMHKIQFDILVSKEKSFRQFEVSVKYK